MFSFTPSSIGAVLELTVKINLYIHPNPHQILRYLSTQRDFEATFDVLNS